MKRKQLPQKQSENLFTRTADKPKARNYHVPPMRGGYRL